MILSVKLVVHLGKTKAVMLYGDPAFNLRSDFCLKHQEKALADAVNLTLAWVRLAKWGLDL